MGEKMKTHDKKIYVGLFGLVLFVLIGYILACPEMLETAAEGNGYDGKIRYVDVRIIAATNQNLLEKVKQGLFREDLYYRLKIGYLHVPPLRKRAGDIPYLAQNLLEQNCDEDVTMTPELIRWMERQSWPGNVRELRNTLESAFYVAKGPEIIYRDVEERFQREKEGVTFMGTAGKDFLESGKDLKTYLADFQKDCILEELRRQGGNLREAARALGVSDQMMKYNLKKYQISVE